MSQLQRRLGQPHREPGWIAGTQSRPLMKTLKSVMVVEDDPDVADILQITLERICKLETRLYTDARQALAALEHCSPDIMLLDIMMPGISGLDALPLIQHSKGGRDCLVIMVSANISAKMRDDCLALGAAAVIAKPFDVLGLGKTLESIWQTHNAENRAAGCPQMESNPTCT